MTAYASCMLRSLVCRKLQQADPGARVAEVIAYAHNGRHHTYDRGLISSVPCKILIVRVLRGAPGADSKELWLLLRTYRIQIKLSDRQRFTFGVKGRSIVYKLNGRVRCVVFENHAEMHCFAAHIRSFGALECINFTRAACKCRMTRPASPK